jgi:YbbR domain-containing protein
VRRIIGIIVHNWPLKLAAIGLATLMYGGLALSQNTQTFQGVVPVRYVNEPKDTVVLPSTPQPVTQVRYFAPTGVQVATSSFLATIDLSGQEGKVGVVSVRIDVTTADSRIRVLGYEPAFATVELDELTSLDVPVEVVHGPVPDGLTLGPTTVDPETVKVTGAQSIVSKVDSVRADVTIQSTGIDVDEEAQLVAVDKLGNAVSPVDVTPPTARVVIPVFSDRQSRTLPVNPIITGRPAAGFEIESVTVTPLVVLVAGDADQLAELSQVDTDPISMTGVSADETVRVGLALPTGVVAVKDEPVTVTIQIRPVTGTRTFSAGLQLLGESSELAYALSVDRVLITIGGSIADLDRLSASTLVATLDVAGLKAGVHDVPVSANLPTGTALVAANPATVKVTVTPAAAGSNAPSPAAGG